jgi:hypothetical protein
LCYYIIVKEKERDVINMPSINMVTIVGKYKGKYECIQDTGLILVDVGDVPVYVEVNGSILKELANRPIDSMIGVKGKLGINYSVFEPQMVVKSDTISFLN